MRFRPSGLDVDLTKCLLVAQCFDLVLNIVFNSSLMGILITLLQLILSMPFMVAAAYLFHKFKTKFSIRSMHNLLTITTTMIIYNGMMIILRFFVGLKLVLSQDETERGGLSFLFLLFFAIPIAFVLAWSFVRMEVTARSASSYGVPISIVKRYERQLGPEKRDRRAKALNITQNSYLDEESSRVESSNDGES